MLSIDNKNESHMDGQLLTLVFVAPDIIDKNYDFFIDILSNMGKIDPDFYEMDNFIFVLEFEEK